MAGPATAPMETDTQTPAPTTPANPADSLRAAALLTLKSKKRPTGIKRQPPTRPKGRPAVDNTSVLLDYGTSDDTPQLPPPPPEFTTVISPPATLHPSYKPRRRENSFSESGQPIEDGEISDVEPTPILLVPSSPAPPSSPVPLSPLKEMNMAAPVSPHSPTKVVDQVDENHVRPGLAMNLREYETSKDIILDLLGWGVEPDYLIYYGLSREIIYYVFTDLNLRLPAALETLDLVPYDPLPLPESPSTAPTLNKAQPSPHETAAISPVTATFPPTSPSTVAPPNGSPAPPARTRRSVHRKSDPVPPSQPLSRMYVHPSLPPKPSTSAAPVQPRPLAPSTPVPAPGPAPLATPSTLSALAPSFTPASVASAGSTPPPVVVDAQKREALLARVIASRRSRSGHGTAVASAPVTRPDTPTPLVTPSSPVSVEATSQPAERKRSPSVEVQMVDEFLNSLGALAEKTPSLSSAPADEATSSRSSRSSSTSDTTPVRTHSPEPMNIDDDLQARPTNSESSGQRTPSVRSIPSRHSSVTNVSARSVPSESGHTYVNGARRGTKRPVAADFVDFDSTYFGENGGGGYGSHAPVRRKTNSFANLPTIRRIVIDVSDDESEESDSGDERHPGRRSAPQSESILAIRQGSTNSPHLASGAATASTTTASAARSGSQTPAALAEKEREITRMRELIAQREQSRLLKMASTSRPSSTPPVPPALASAPASRPLTPGPAPPAQPNATPSAHTLVPVTGTADGQASTTTAADGSSRPSSVPPSSVASDAPEEEQEQQVASAHDDPQDVAPEPETGAPAGAHTPTGCALEHTTDDDQVLAFEAHPGPVITTRETEGFGHQTQEIPFPNSSADQAQHSPAVDAHTSSPLSVGGFEAYSSVLRSYPLLRSRTAAVRGDGGEARLTCGAGKATLTVPDLTPLKMSCALAQGKIAPDARVCQYEIPGGGECRDGSCEDVHLSRLLAHADPSDEETALYLRDVLSVEGQASPSAGAIRRALEEARQRGPMTGSGISKGQEIEGRVAMAFELLTAPR